MLVKILGILDIFIAVCFWMFGMFRMEFLSGFILVLGLILLAKGIIFITGISIASVIDIIVALMIIWASSVYMPVALIFIISLFLLQKGIFSLWN
jgi:hypothetical protein